MMGAPGPAGAAIAPTVTSSVSGDQVQCLTSRLRPSQALAARARETGKERSPVIGTVQRANGQNNNHRYTPTTKITFNK
jgi:hypothetical protein